MRSRVEIVARKSDHICVVRDVPDMRGSWYQRQQQFTQSSYSMGGAGSQHSSSGSVDHQSAPAGQLKPPAIAAPAGQTQTAPATPAAAAAPKASFAALFGKHPAIKEEPTTPGGTLTSETPPPSSASIGKRSPFKCKESSPTAHRQSAASTVSNEQMSQIIGLLNELKSDLRQDINQLNKRVDSMDSNLGKVIHTVARLDKHYAPAAAQPSSSSIQPKSSSSTPAKPPSDSAQQVAAGSKQSSVRAAPELADSTAPHQRDKSKSPHRRHHHHHHHRKAAHPTPGATPTVSQTDLRPAAGGTGAAGDAEGAKQERASREPSPQLRPPATNIRVPGSFEQSDEDQDATSKL